MFKPTMKAVSVVILLILLILFHACNKSSEKSSTPTDNEKNSETSTGPFGETSFIQPLDSKSIAEAHRFIPAYPGAEIDKSKGLFNNSEMGEHWNLIYYTADPVSDVETFFLDKISHDYLKKVSSEDNKDWLLYEYNVPGVRHSGNISIRKTEEGNTEIIYMILRKPE